MIHKTEIQGVLVGLLVSFFCPTGIAGAQSNKPAAPAAAAQSSTLKKESIVNFKKITPNLIVADMDKSLKFYRDVLGFSMSQTVPDKPPFIFAWMRRGDAEIFLNQHMPPQPGQPDLFAGRPIGGTLSMYLPLEGIEELLKTVQGNSVKIAVPLHKEFYGMKEFAVFDPDGYLIIFAERAE